MASTTRVLLAGASPESAAGDAFSRMRVSQAINLIESKLLFDKATLIWNEVLDGGATSVHSTADASVTMGVSANADGATRTTKVKANYHPGRGQLVYLTGNFLAHDANTVKRIGAFDDNNGMFFESNGTTLRVVIRKGGSDTAVNQANWNLDKLDGNGPSGVTLDISKAQIFSIDYQWLGVGTVRFGLNVDGEAITVHAAHHANIDTTTYTASPNLPVRYQITSSGGTGSLEQICSLILSEGAREDLGIIRSASTDGVHVDANDTANVYAVVGVRLKVATHVYAIVKMDSLSVISETNDDFEWFFVLNPTVAGTFTFADETNSAVQIARGATANTVTGGTRIAGGYAKQDTALVFPAPSQNILQLGLKDDGTADEFVLCVRPLSANADIQGSVTWREVL